mmetsp:Transcript_41478/g.117464  ORF Transcript_41478/g.117464 Transcript_41478/m.117464 type:complete len:379 (+) Transcript_41478:48-1184(+)
MRGSLRADPAHPLREVGRDAAGSRWPAPRGVAPREFPDLLRRHGGAILGLGLLGILVVHGRHGVCTGEGRRRDDHLGLQNDGRRAAGAVGQRPEGRGALAAARCRPEGHEEGRGLHDDGRSAANAWGCGQQCALVAACGLGRPEWNEEGGCLRRSAGVGRRRRGGHEATHERFRAARRRLRPERRRGPDVHGHHERGGRRIGPQGRERHAGAAPEGLAAAPRGAPRRERALHASPRGRRHVARGADVAVGRRRRKNAMGLARRRRPRRGWRGRRRRPDVGGQRAPAGGCGPQRCPGAPAGAPRRRCGVERRHEAGAGFPRAAGASRGRRRRRRWGGACRWLQRRGARPSVFFGHGPREAAGATDGAIGQHELPQRVRR